MIEYIENNICNERILIITDIHNCHIDWYDTKNDDRMSVLCSALKEQYKSTPYDCILSLGDYSLDFWKWQIGGSYLWSPPVSRTTEFMEKYASRFPAKAYFLAGNHEQYGNEKWQEITGNPREFAVVYGNYVFAMLDTFAGDLDPTENHDGVYTGINTEFLTAILKKHPDKKIVLCAHDIVPEKESNEAKSIICSENRILCAFTGHTHDSDIKITGNDMRNLPIIYCGNFSYSVSDKPKNWGYRILNLSDGNFSTEYIVNTTQNS